VIPIIQQVKELNLPIVFGLNFIFILVFFSFFFYQFYFFIIKSINKNICTIQTAVAVIPTIQQVEELNLSITIVFGLNFIFLLVFSNLIYSKYKNIFKNINIVSMLHNANIKYRVIPKKCTLLIFLIKRKIIYIK